MSINKCFICGKVTEDNYFCYDHAIELHKLLIGKVNLLKKPDFKQHCHVCGEHENREIIEFSNWGYFCDKDITEAFYQYVTRLKYKNYNVFDLKSLDIDKLENVGADPTGWRVFYTDKINNYVMFYPFSEFHGGGQPYLIDIRNNNFSVWISNNPNFEDEIRQQIEKK